MQWCVGNLRIQWTFPGQKQSRWEKIKHPEAPFLEPFMWDTFYTPKRKFKKAKTQEVLNSLIKITVVGCRKTGGRRKQETWNFGTVGYILKALIGCLRILKIEHLRSLQHGFLYCCVPYKAFRDWLWQNRNTVSTAAKVGQDSAAARPPLACNWFFRWTTSYPKKICWNL